MFFSGKRPSNLGVTQGKLVGVSKKPNSVSSQVDAHHPAFIDALKFSGKPQDWQALQGKIAALKGATIISATPNYLHIEFKTAFMGFVDDVELFQDGKQIHVRSASRLGYSDLGMNRKRIEHLRKLVS